MAETIHRVRPWSVEGFRGFWARPDLSLVPRVRDAMTSDIVGHWPRPIGTVRGADAYMAVIEAVAGACPDLSLAAPEYAEQGDLRFLRWVATATLGGALVTFNGLDRMRIAADGRVSENYIFCDHPLFAEVAARL
jgi:hypothetical protein